jgi:hypothetical protein
MKLRTCLVPVLLLLLPGCLLVRHDTVYVPKKSARARSACHPSEYWDGDECRHKGKGHGARKHDH